MLPGHGKEYVERRVKTKKGVACIQILCPVVILEYNKYMGGVDKSDQYMAYDSVLRRTVRFWKTPFLAERSSARMIPGQAGTGNNL